MRLRSCFSRYVRYLLRSCACSVLTLFVNSNMMVNKTGIQILSTAIFVLVTMIDSFVFAMYLGRMKHIKYGLIYPYTLFTATVYVGHFLIPTARWRYFFLPFNIFTNYGLSRLMSITAMHILVILFIILFASLGRRKFYKIK